VTTGDIGGERRDLAARQGAHSLQVSTLSRVRVSFGRFPSRKWALDSMITTPTLRGGDPRRRRRRG
jgi:hypothetical protein